MGSKTAVKIGNIAQRLPPTVVSRLIETAVHEVQTLCDGIVERFTPLPMDSDYLISRLPKRSLGDLGFFLTNGVDLHTDGAIGSHTIGIIFQGDHYLATSRGKAFDLSFGDVFLLDFNKKHGASRHNDSKSDSSLVFLAYDFKVNCWAEAVDVAQKVIDTFNREPNLATL